MPFTAKTYAYHSSILYLYQSKYQLHHSQKLMLIIVKSRTLQRPTDLKIGYFKWLFLIKRCEGKIGNFII